MNEFQSFKEFLINEAIENNSEITDQELLVLINDSHGKIDESIIRKVFGAATGIVLGKKIMKILLKILNINKGPLYNVLTSKVVLARVGYEFGKN